jgi:hypothetical protein
MSYLHIFYLTILRRDSRVGAVLREQNALPHNGGITEKTTAKDAIKNGAGRRRETKERAPIKRLIA